MVRCDQSGNALRSSPFDCRILKGDEELEQVLSLLYRTFVEEIPQHAANPQRLLVDRFHSENCYLGCFRDGRLVGSVAYRDRRPFSLDLKLTGLDTMVPMGRRWCEIRLLAVEHEFRRSNVIVSLLSTLVQHALSCGRDAGLISGTTRQLPLYQHLGFQAFGPLVGKEEALFQPMFVLLEAFQTVVGRTLNSIPIVPVSSPLISR